MPGHGNVEPTPRDLVEFLGLPVVEEQRDVVTSQVFGFRKDPIIYTEYERDDLEMLTAVTLDTFYNL